MKRTSYGCICLDLIQNKTLLIQRTHSPEFLHFIRGMFTHKDIECILLGCTKDEHDFIANLIDMDDSLVKMNLSRIMEPLYTFNCQKYADLGTDSIRSHKNQIRELLNQIAPRSDYEWSWPKGGTIFNENTVDTAIRETLEETGYSIDRLNITDIPVQHIKITTYFGMTCEINYYVALVDIATLGEQGGFDFKEVRDAKWVSFDQAKKLLPNNYIEILNNVLTHVSKHVNRYVNGREEP